MSSFTRLRKKAVTCKCPVIETGCKWKGVSGPFGKSFFGAAAVAYGNGRWVTFGADFETGRIVGKIYYSDDGVTWTLADSPPDFISGSFGGGVAYGNRWVAVGGNISGTGKKIYYSEDGITWFPASGEPFGNGYGFGVAYDKKGRWVAVGQGADASGVTGKNIWYSDDGIDWSPAPGEPFGKGTDDSSDTNTPRGYGARVVYGNRWVAVGNGGRGNTPTGKNIWYSDDGIQWTPVPGPFGKQISEGSSQRYIQSDVAYNGRWVAVGLGLNATGEYDGKNIYWSDDGVIWTAVSGPFGKDGFSCGTCVAYGNRWIAGGVGSSPIYYSDDGISWTPEFTTEAAILECLPLAPTAVAYGNRWVVVGISPTGTSIYYE